MSTLHMIRPRPTGASAPLRASKPVSPIEEAESPATKPSVLGALSKHQDPEIRRRVAMNPSTPRNALLRVWKEFPELLIENPLVDLWLISGRAELSGHVPLEILARLFIALHQSGRGHEVVEWLPDPTLRFRLLESAVKEDLPGFPDAFAADPEAHLRGLVIDRVLRPAAGHARDTEAFFSAETLLELARDPSAQNRRQLAEALCQDPFVPFRKQARTVPAPVRTPVLLVLCETGDDETIEVLAKDRNLPEEVAVKLARHRHPGIRLTLARNPDLPRPAAEILLRDEAANVRATLARNTGFADARLRLAGDDDPQVRAAIPDNPAATPEEVEALSTDRSLLVRRAVAGSQHATSDVLVRMAEAEPDELADVLIKNASLPPASRVFLIRSASDANQLDLVRHWKVTPKTFAEMLPELGVKAREALARRAGLPEPVVLALAKDKKRSVRELVRSRLYKGSFQQDFPIVRSIIDVFLDDPDPSLRAGILADHRVTDEHVRRALEDRSPIVRAAVSTTVTPPDRAITARLASDISPLVRLAAAKRWISDQTESAAFWTRPLACDEVPGLPDFAAIVRPLIDHPDAGIAARASLELLRALPGCGAFGGSLVPRLIENISAALARLEAIASAPDAPEAVLRLLVESPFTPLCALDRLVARTDPGFMKVFAHRLVEPAIDRSVADWEARSRPDVPGKRGASDIRLSSAPVRALRSAAEGPSSYRRFVAIRNPRISKHVVAKIAESDPCPLLRLAARARLEQKDSSLLRFRNLVKIIETSAGAPAA